MPQKALGGEMHRKIVAVALATWVLLGCTAAFALQSGDIVTFLIPIDSNQPDPPNGPTDKLIFTGGRVTAVDTTGCGQGSRPVQNAILVDPTGGRPGRIVGIVVVSESDPVPPGTSLSSHIYLETCWTASTTYNKYRGTVR